MQASCSSRAEGERKMAIKRKRVQSGLPGIMSSGSSGLADGTALDLDLFHATLACSRLHGESTDQAKSSGTCSDTQATRIMQQMSSKKRVLALPIILYVARKSPRKCMIKLGKADGPNAAVVKQLETLCAGRH